ncbi:MAG: flagellar filament capping protein FliD [Deltaproteobacteria bacterium]|nr:flagellar filament capping protein FliD [Deltaproteobacteria bacterium]
MATITFGGLATGLDTTSLISELMAVERQPLKLLENDKTWLNSRLVAFQQFDAKLNSFLSKIGGLGSTEEIQAKQATLSAEGFFTAGAETDAAVANYQIEVVSLAQVQKAVSQGYADKSAQEFGTGTLTLTVGENDPVAIEISAENNSLQGIADAINAAGAGVSAAIINDGTVSPYRLVLTGENVAASYALDASGLSGGSYDAPALVTTQAATQAHIRVDNVDIYADGNTLDEAIPGVTLDLLKAEAGTTTRLEITNQSSSLLQNMKDFVSGYNGVISFISSQTKSTDSSSGGVLGADSGLSVVKRRLQNLLTERIDTGGSFSALSQLGLKTAKDGTLTLDEEAFSKAVQENLPDVEKLLAGDGETQGIASRFQDYLEGMTSSVDGFLKGRTTSINANIKRIDSRIERMEMRLEKRQSNLEKQFNALETLVSSLNATGDYLSQQLESINNMWAWNQK